MLLQWNVDYPNTYYSSGQLSEQQIDCSIRVFCHQVYALLESLVTEQNSVLKYVDV